MSKHQGTLFIISGPSGVGKTTVVTQFLQQYHNLYKVSRVVTYTTRLPRSGDIDGVDYHFITQHEFERKIVDGFFLEWSGEYGACYGTPGNVLDELVSGESKLLVIDRVGAAQIIKKYKHAVLIWIEVVDTSVLFDRLTKRNTELSEQVRARLLLAAKEIEQERVAPMYHYRIENDELNASVKGFFEIIAPRCQLRQD